MMSWLDAYTAPKQDIPRRVYLAISTVVAALLMALWCLWCYGGVVREDFLPTPDAVVLAGIEGIKDGSLAVNTGVSVSEIMSGFIIASILAVPLGILMGSFKVVEAAIEPVTNFVRYLPVSALIPLLILWVGIGIEEKISVIFIGTFFQQLILIADVSRSVPHELLDVSYTLGASRRTVVTRALIPATMPGVIDTLSVRGAPGKAKLRISSVTLRFTPRTVNPVTALEYISLDVGPQEFSVIVGPSGCGKSSLLRLIAGLIQPTSGAIYLDARRVTRPGKDRGMVFQSYTLFHWLTVRQNVEFGLKIANIKSDERARIARKFLAEVGLEDFENAYPKQLSGGMMQRVAFG